MARAALLAMVLVCVLTIRVTHAEDQCERCIVPPNVDLPSDFAKQFEIIYARSETFRDQCERISGADHARVTVRLNPTLPRSCQALTEVRRRGRSIFADVQLRPSSSFAEMLAHEFEHILEQLEGLDMKRLAYQRGSGVYEVQFQLFESVRAQRAGRMVAEEVRHQEKCRRTQALP